MWTRENNSNDPHESNSSTWYRLESKIVSLASTSIIRTRKDVSPRSGWDLHFCLFKYGAVTSWEKRRRISLSVKRRTRSATSRARITHTHTRVMGLNSSIKTSTKEGGRRRAIVWLQHHIHITLSAPATILSLSLLFFNVCVVVLLPSSYRKKVP